MDPTLGTSAGEPGPGFQEDGGIIAPAFAPGPGIGGELDLSDDLAWDEFLPDEDESEDELDYEVEFSALAAEDAALAAEDLELRWDAFAADDESEDDEESARVEAVLDRMEQRAKTYGDSEDAVDDHVAPDDTVVPVDEVTLDDAVVATDGDPGYVTVAAPAAGVYDAYDIDDADGEAEAVEVLAVAAVPDVVAAHVTSEPEEPVAVEDVAGDEEQDEEEEIDLLAIRAAWDDFRATWEDTGIEDDAEVASSASASSREDERVLGGLGRRR